MKKSRHRRRRVRLPHPGWQKAFRKEGTGYPNVSAKLRWVGKPRGDDKYKLVGMTLELVWYATPEDRQAERNECPVSLISIDSCQETQVNGGAVQAWCENKATRCDCDATLVELVDQETLYGQWLRRQSHLGYQSLDCQTELITPLRIEFTFGRPKRSTVRNIAQRGVNLVPNTDNLLDIRIVAPAPSDLSSLQVDRLTELYEEVGAYVPHAARFLLDREKKCARLGRAVQALRTDAEVIGQRRNEANARRDRARAEFDSLNRRLRDAASELSVMDEQFAQSRDFVVAAENELRDLERLLGESNRARVTLAQQHGAPSDEFKAACEQANRMSRLVADAASSLENAIDEFARVNDKPGFARTLAMKRRLVAQQRAAAAKIILDTCEADAERVNEEHQDKCRALAKLKDQICRLGGDA